MLAAMLPRVYARDFLKLHLRQRGWLARTHARTTRAHARVAYIHARVIFPRPIPRPAAAPSSPSAPSSSPTRV